MRALEGNNGQHRPDDQAPGTGMRERILFEIGKIKIELVINPQAGSVLVSAKQDGRVMRVDALDFGTETPMRREAPKNPLDLRCADCNGHLSPKTITYLRKAGIIFLGELASHSLDQLLKIRGIGQSRLEEIKSLLRHHDLKMGTPIDPSSHAPSPRQ